MQKFTYDMFSRIEIPTFVLSNVYHHQIGVLNCIDIDSINVNFNMNSQQEISFDIYKELNGEKCELWDDIVSLRYIYVPEHHEYYKIEVSTDDESKTVKHLVCSSASEYELSNKIIRSLEINTDTDILRNNTNDQTIPPYAPNVLYNPSDPSNSILHRTLADKAPDWSIKHVDSTIANIQRTFSVSNQKIYDFLTQTLAKEYDCLFVFDSVDRTISAYDLLNICDDCGKRGEFTDECPKCHGHNISKGYGNDTHIFINYNNFSEKITLEGDEGAVKNCFSVQGGDDIMSATVRNINPNGSEYIYNFSEADYKDMPQSLIDKLEDYQEEYNRVLPEYQSITEKWYDSINNYYYYKTSMMPRVNGTAWKANVHYDINDRVYVKTLPTWCYLECVKAGVSGSTEFDATSVTEGQIIEDGEVKWKACKNILSMPDAKGQLDNVIDYFRYEVVYFYNEIPESITSVSNEVKNVAGFAVDSLYKVEIVQETNYPKKDNVNWFGKIKVYNSANPEDSCTSTDPIMVYIRGVNDILDYTNYISQQVDKRLHKADITYESVLDIEIPRTADMKYDKDADTLFKNALTEYSLDSLSNFEKSYKACLDTLSSNGIKDKTSKYMGWDTYSIMYEPYYTRLTWIQDEMNKREETVDYYDAEREKYADQMREYNNALNLQTYLGDDLFKIFWSYIREDTYQNSNYISTGLSDGAVINDAKQLLEVAQDELKKACELQVTLNDDISNLLNTEGFKDYKDKFEIGDFIVCEVDDIIYRLRLISASFSYSDSSNINLTFSNFTKITNFLSDAQSIINSAQSISGSYNAVMHQVIKNTNTTSEVDNWKENGIASSDANIISNADQEVVIDQNGLVARQYNDIDDTYSEKQFKITHNYLSFTDDNWETTTMGIGEAEYTWWNETATVEHPNVGWNTDIGYGVNAKFVTAGFINGTQIIGGDIYSDNYRVADPSQGIEANGSYIGLRTGEFSLAGGNLIGYWDEDEHKYKLSYSGNVSGHIDVDVGSQLGVWTVQNDGLYGTNAYLKPSDIAVTGNVSAYDFIYDGVSITTTIGNINTAISGKQDKLTAGTNISIDSNNVISATGGGTEVVANPSDPATDILTTIEIDDVVYEIQGGGGGGLTYFHENQQALYGENSIPDYLVNNFKFKHQDVVRARYDGHEPTTTWGDVEFHSKNVGVEAIVCTWERTIITNLWSTSTGEDNGIVVITKDPNACGLDYIDRTNGYSTETGTYMWGDSTEEQSYYMGAHCGFAASHFTYQGATYYVVLCHHNSYMDWSYQYDSIKEIGTTLDYVNDRQVFSSVAEFGESILTMHNDGQSITGYSGLHRTGTLAFFAGASNTSGTDAPIKIYADGTYEGIGGFVDDVVVNNASVVTDRIAEFTVPEIEANPSGTPSDNLSSIEIDGTIYQLATGASVMVGATDLTDGVEGLAPKPYKKQNTKFLRGDATWSSVVLSGLTTPTSNTGVNDNIYIEYDGTSSSQSTQLYQQRSPGGRTTWSMELDTSAYDTVRVYDVWGAFDQTINVSDIYSSGSTVTLYVNHAYLTFQGSTVTYSNDQNYNDWVLTIAGITTVTVPTSCEELYTKINGTWLPLGLQNSIHDVEVDGVSVVTSGVAEIDLSNYATLSDVPEIEANPSETPTDVLNSININGTAYEIQGGGGSSGGAAYTEVVLWGDTNGATSPSNVTLIDDLSNYDAIYIVHASNVEPTYRSSQIIPVSSIDKTGANRFGVYDTGADSYYYTALTYTDDTHLVLDGWGSSYPIKYYKIVGIKYGGNLSPIIYSTEEREVGVWTDGKPLYQRTYEYSGEYTSNNVLQMQGLSDMEHIIIVNSQCEDTGGHILFLPYANATANYIRSYYLTSQDNTFNLLCNSNSPIKNPTITLQYTKTTDTAGSGAYNTLGIPNVHYDGSEKVIGTWFGETLYERTFTGLATNINGDNWVNISGIDATTWKDAVNVEIYSNSSDVNNKLTRIALGEARVFNGNVQVTTSVAYNREINVATIQYTKTS